MALEDMQDRLDTASPVSSGGRDSPVPRSGRGEEEDFSRDKGFRRYAANIDRALSIFDTQLQEWADYISFLGRLLKALQSHPSNISVVPSKSLVARRLAQCLAPSLPSGVHQKALEVYSYIFTLITPTRVARDLSLYLPGLSPVLSFASLTVRSPFLILLRRYILPLPAPTLRPACKALILTLLPGLEDQGSEDFDSTYKLINDFRNALRAGAELEDSYFWQCFFLATITSPSRRLGSLAYLVHELPKLGSGTTSTNDVPSGTAIASSKMLTTPEPGLLVRCFAAGLRDEQILIQRGFLDLLVTHLPLHASVFISMISPSDVELLMTAASSVVARRDMSLNRRLWSWLLGPEPLPSADDRPTSSGTDKGNTAARTEYFEKHGLKPLTNSILALINADPRDAAERARPFRICLSLMDRWEIGGLVVPLVFLPAIGSVKRYQEEEGVQKKEFQEVLRSASVFFNGVESGLIWSEINSLIFAALEDATAAPIGAEHQIVRKMASLELVRFIINHFNIREEEMLAVHIPLTSLGTVCTINTISATEAEEDDEDGHKEPPPILAAAISLALELIQNIPPAVLAPRSVTERRDSAHFGEKGALDDGSVVIRLKTFYTQHQGDLTLSPPPVSSSDAAELFLHRATQIFSHSLSATFTGYGEGKDFRYTQEQQSWVANNAQLLILLLQKTSSPSTSAPSTPSSPISQALSTEITALFNLLRSKLPWGRIMQNQRLPFSTASAINDAVCALYPRYIDYEQLYTLTPLLVQQFWERLDPRDVRFHVETVRCIWKLHYALCNNAADGGERDVEGCLSSLMQQADSQNQDGTDAVGSFGILWHHSLNEDKDKPLLPLLKQPLFLVLDLLSNSNSNSNGTHKWATIGDAKTFLQSLNGENFAQLFHVLVCETADFPRFNDGYVGDWAENVRAVSSYDREAADCSQHVYVMETLGRILAHATQEMWHVLATAVVQYKNTERRIMGDGPDGDGRPVTMQRYFARICLRGIGGVGIGRGGTTMRYSILPLNKASLRLLGQLWCDKNPYRNDEDMRGIHGGAVRFLCWWLDKLNQNAEGGDKALQSEILDVMGKTLRILAGFNGSPFEAAFGQMDVALHNMHLQEERRQTLRSPLSEPLPAPPSLLRSLKTTIIGALHHIPSQAVMSDWAVLVRECLRLNIFNVDQLEPLATSCTDALRRGNATLNISFQKRHLEPETHQHTYIESEKSMCAKIDILECLVLKAHELVHAEDILMLEAKGRKSTTREDRGSDKGFLGGIFGSTGEAGNEVPEKDTPITPRQRVQALITSAAQTTFYAWNWADRGKKSVQSDSKHSFHYTSVKLRSRARKLLEVLFQIEAGPCMETMVGLWISDTKETEKAALQLINVLDRTQPQNAMPLLFELVHDRAIGPQHPTFGWRMTQSSHGHETVTTTADVLAFMNSYTLSLENDAVVEVWGDAAAFLRDVLANPMTYRAMLPSLVKFLGLVGEKIAKTMRGKSDKVMRREVADLWLRLVMAVFTTNPVAWQTDSSPATSQHPRHQPQDIVSVLASITDSLPQILSDNTLILQAANTLSSSIIQPTIRAKQFPETATPTFLHLLHSLGQLGAGQQNSSSAGLMKVFRRDVTEAFNVPNFFSCTPCEFDSWKGILKLWTGKDRDRIMTELLGRIVAPTTAGIVFGVGATSARMEADARTKATLKRITSLFLADGRDAWVASLPPIFAKVTELLTATTTSSPSSATRAEIYVLLRALIMSTSAIHLSFLWPSLNSELEACLSSCLPGGNSREAEREREVWDGAALVQSCKLLEQLLDVAPEEWQVGEWTFVRDGADSLTPVSSEDNAVALTDRLVVELGIGEGRPLAEPEMEVDLRFETEGMEREDVILRLRPFFKGLVGRQVAELLRSSGGSKTDDTRMWRGIVGDVFVEGVKGRKE